MTLPAPTYDLVLMLDPQAEESARAKIVSDAVTTIEAQGEMVHQDDWGERALTYPIEHRTSAQYHLLQFHVSQKALLEGLDRTLRITDGVLRHRIIKLKPGTPEAPNVGSAPPPRQADAGESAPPPRTAAEDAPAETPAAETPAAETPAAETAALETPPAETVAVETPPAEAPAEAAPAEDAS
jgi:small subunit ribosomal protein S6